MIIALCGPARSGKDTVADVLTEFFGANKVARIQIAGPLKRCCREVFDWTEEHTDGSLKDVPDERYPRPCPKCTTGFYIDEMGPCPVCKGAGITYLTPRHAMQQLGGEFAEATFPPIYAVAAARAAHRHSVDVGVAIVTDCRFVRDIQAVKDVGGIIIQVHRQAVEELIGAGAAHGSELAGTTPEFLALVDHHIHNDGTLNDLQDNVVNLLVTHLNRILEGSKTPPEA